jgi:hypothetical protein
MGQLFELEWLGGATEHFFRRARPDVDKVPWGTIDVGRYTPELLEAVRRSWTEVSMNEYRAIASFAEVVRCMADAMAPLDMIGMASDFIADEALHSELAARVAMELGGAAPIEVDMDRFAIRTDPKMPAKMRLNEVMMRVCCVGEAFASGMGAPTLKLASHPMIRAINEIIMSDEARHKRLGALYLEWAADDWDDQERERLSRVTEQALKGLSVFWSGTPSPVKDGVTARGFSVEHLHELGWLESARSIPLAKQVAQELLVPLENYGVRIDESVKASLFS